MHGYYEKKKGEGLWGKSVLTVDFIGGKKLSKGERRMNHQEVIDFIRTIRFPEYLDWEEEKRIHDKREEVIEYIRKLAGVKI